MPAYILVGEDRDFDEFISSYKKKNSIKDLDTLIYSEKILIEDTRDLIKSLQLKSSNNKLYIVKNEITLEAQNSLLKNIEELESYNTIIFCTTAVSSLLPTIQSRCFILNFRRSSNVDMDVSGYIQEYLDEKLGLWEMIDRIEESKNENSLFLLQSSLRQIFLDKNESQKKKAYQICKKLLRLSPLIEKNNINLRIALEKVFVH